MRSPPGLVHTVDIPDYRKAAKLPADVEQNLSLFTGMLADNLHADKNMAKNLLDGVEAYAKNHKIVYSWRKRSIPTHSGWLYPLTFDAGKGLKEA